MLFFAILYFWVLRFWLLSFDCKMMKILNKNKWQSIINKKYIKNMDIKKNKINNWYLKKKSKYGNYSFCLKNIIFPLYLISISIDICFIILLNYKWCNNHNKNTIVYQILYFHL